MSDNFKEIDKIFRTELRDYSQKAPEDAWVNIDQAVNKSGTTKTFSFYKIAAAVVAMVIVGSGLFFLTNNTTQINNASLAENNIQEKIPENKVEESSVEESEVIVDNKINEFNKTENIKEQIPVIYNPETVNSEVKQELFAKVEIEKEDYIFNKLSQKQVIISTEDVELAIVDKREHNIETYLNTLPDFNASYALSDLIEVETPKENKWQVGGEFSPLYSYRNITSTSGIYDKDFYNSTESPIMSYTGGLNLQFKAMGRLTIQAGVYYTSMGQALDYMSVYSNTAYELVDAKYKDRLINAYSIENSSGDVSFNSSHVIIDNKSVRVVNLSASKGVADVYDANFTDLEAEIEQNFQYLEVPVILRYTLIDRNIDFNIIGGFGANFLVGNNVAINYAGNKEIIGETYGVNPVNYNGTLGIGIDYPIMKRINIRVEPSIKYYINELNSNSSVESHPYSVGIYTGINYSF